MMLCWGLVPTCGDGEFMWGIPKGWIIPTDALK
jgi:hypothetical protein